MVCSRDEGLAFLQSGPGDAEDNLYVEEAEITTAPSTTSTRRIRTILVELVQYS